VVDVGAALDELQAAVRIDSPPTQITRLQARRAETRRDEGFVFMRANLSAQAKNQARVL
jgi:hypothetical protein